MRDLSLGEKYNTKIHDTEVERYGGEAIWLIKFLWKKEGNNWNAKYRWRNYLRSWLGIFVIIPKGEDERWKKTQINV